MTRWITVVAVAVPGLVLAGFGLMHPLFLAPSTAPAWWQLHIPLIPLFPLLAVALWVLLRGERGVLAWAARVAAYGYACFYTGLDVLAGIGAGLVTDVQQAAARPCWSCSNWVACAAASACGAYSPGVCSPGPC